MNAPVSNSKSRLLSIALCAALAVITACLYWPVHTHTFIQLDDPDYVTANPHVRAGLTPDDIYWAFTQSHSSNWHPVTWMTHMLDCQLFGLNNPGAHHLVNVGFHVANTLLLFLLLQGITRARWPSAFVAALFALHPLHVESVAWVAERKDVLSTFFFLLTLLAYARYVSSAKCQVPSAKCQVPSGGGPNAKLLTAENAKNAKGIQAAIRNPQSAIRNERIRNPQSAFWYVLALVLFALGLMSKPMLVTLPFVLLLLDYWPFARFELNLKDFKLGALWPFVREKAAFFALSALSCVVTIWAQGQGRSISSVEEVPLFHRLANAMAAYLQYVEKMVWPTRLAIFYPFQPEARVQAAVLGLLFLTVVTVLVVRQAKQRPYMLVGWLWYVGTLVPVIGLLQVGAQEIADRYTYIPLLGLFIALAWRAAEFDPPWKPARLLLGLAAAIVLAACAFQTSKQLACWKNDRILFEHAAKVTDRNFLALGALGDMLIRDGKSAEAVDYLTQAVKFGPNYVPSWFRLAVALEGVGRYDEALSYYQTALKMDPSNSEPHNAYGVSLMERGKLAEADVELREAHRLKPGDPLVWINLVLLLRKEGKLGEAVHECEGIVQLDPTSERGHLLFGETLVLVGRPQEGFQHYTEALRLNPNSAGAHVGLGLALIDKREFAGAMAQFGALLKAEPKNPQALDGLGYALAMQGKFDEAKARFLEAQKLDPKYAQGYFHYAMCLSASKDVKEAVAQYHKALSLNPQLPLALNNLAWLLASDPDPQVRNGKEAVELGERACKLVNYEQPFYIGTLAAAYAEAGRFSDAVATAEKARDLALARGMQPVAQRNEELLKLYRAGQPFHEGKE